MKNLFFVTLMAISMIACSPKTGGKIDTSNLINKAFMAMINAGNTGDWKSALDMTYPKLFDLTPRANLEQLYSQFDMMGIKMLTQNAKLSGVTDFVTKGTEQFAKGKMTGTQKIQVGDASMVDLLFNQMKSQMGADAASKIKKVDDGLEMELNEDVYIINDTTKDKMYFLQAGEQVKPMLDKILPSDILEKLSK